MKIVVHIGMHKTGSSSIQQSFAGLDHPNLKYIEWARSGNHCGLFVLLFQDPEKTAHYHGFKARGAEFTRRLPELREDWLTRVSQQLDDANDKVVIFSAEDISAIQFENAAQRLHDFFADWSHDITVIGYARVFADFAASSFQQRLKGGSIPNIFEGGVSPCYRARFEKIDKIFGRENVRLKAFSSDHLQCGNVVQDFAHEIGIAPLKKDQIIRTNESLSLEAVALLYVQRRMGQGFVQGFDCAQVANNRFINQLATIGSRKFAFSPQMIAPVLDKERDDIAWMEERLGHPFSEAGKAHPDAISSLDDLVNIALEQYDAVQTLLGGAAKKDSSRTTEALVHALERLREQSYAQVAGARQANRKLKHKGSFNMSIKTERQNPTEAELRIRRRLASILWNADHIDNIPSDSAERKAAFDLVKKDYQKKALDLARRLENNNLKLVELEAQD